MAILTTSAHCRFRFARKKPVSYGTLLAGPFASALVVLMCCRVYYDGWRVFTPDYWHGVKGGWFGCLVELALVGGACVLPAIGIAVYYQVRGDHGATRHDACRH